MYDISAIYVSIYVRTARRALPASAGPCASSNRFRAPRLTNSSSSFRLLVQVMRLLECGDTTPSVSPDCSPALAGPSASSNRFRAPSKLHRKELARRRVSQAVYEASASHWGTSLTRKSRFSLEPAEGPRHRPTVGP